MAETKSEGTYTIVSVPDADAPAVIEFLTNLRSQDDDTAGHMLPGIHLGGGLGGRMGLSFTTNTGCTVTAGANDPTKVVQDCTDSDPT